MATFKEILSSPLASMMWLSTISWRRASKKDGSFNDSVEDSDSCVNDGGDASFGAKMIRLKIWILL